MIYDPSEFQLNNLAEFSRKLVHDLSVMTSNGTIEMRRGEFTLWTDAIKKWLSNEAEVRGLRPIYCDRNGSSEFLLDFVWWQDGPCSRAILACESELGNTRDPRRNAGRVAEDFDKLLSFKACLKLMIFDSYWRKVEDDPKQDEIIAELNRYLKEYGDHRAGEQYLAVDLSPKRSAWICRIVNDGQDASHCFEKLQIDK